MVSETLVSALLSASIVGAGLTFALFAIVIPAIANIEESFNGFLRYLKEINKKSDPKDFRGALVKGVTGRVLRGAKTDRVKWKNVFVGHDYDIIHIVLILSLVSFVFYCFSTVLPIFWWGGGESNDAFIFLSMSAFITATFLLLVSGVVVFWVYLRHYHFLKK